MTKIPHNHDLERQLVQSVLVKPGDVLAEAGSMGFTHRDFHLVAHQTMWRTVEQLHESGKLVSPETLRTSLIATGTFGDYAKALLAGELPKDTGAAGMNAALILEYSLRRQQLAAADDFKLDARNLEAGLHETLSKHQERVDFISARTTRMMNPVLGNPAKDLLKSKGWHTASGMPWLDRMLRLTSGEVHSFAGDPGAGKTTIAIHMAVWNAKHGTPVVMILAEPDEMEVKLSMLALVKEPGMDIHFLNRVRYNPDFRTPKNIERVDRMWRKYYGTLPIRIYRVTTGLDEVVSIASSTVEPSLIIGDHAYAIVGQTPQGPNVKEHQLFVHLFGRFLNACKRQEHVGVMFNQFKLSGRRGDERGPDAQYGGSAVRNISGTVVHLWPVTEAATAGYVAIQSKCWKVRARLVASQRTGELVDPLQSDEMFWIESRYRHIVDKIPVA